MARWFRLIYTLLGLLGLSCRLWATVAGGVVVEEETYNYRSGERRAACPGRSAEKHSQAGECSLTTDEA